MHTLQALKTGKITLQDLGPEKRLKISEGLTEFPQEFFQFADDIEILDLSGNQFSNLPDDFIRFKKLKILFLSENKFTHIPDVLGKCENLEMIGFKSNQIKVVTENSLPPKTRWLILTDNKISKLPNSMGRLTRLRKLALAGNQLTELPDSMADCRDLELVRLSANNLNKMPDWLFELPKLAWLAFSGNPCMKIEQSQESSLPEVMLDSIQLAEQIGVGASGVIHRGSWSEAVTGFERGSEIAVKLFKGEITSDGYPQDELACCLAAGQHPNLINVLAYIPDTSQLGLVMDLIPPVYVNLGNPPSLKTCTRDTFTEDAVFTLDEIVNVLKQMAYTIRHLHLSGVSHGDVYAHNILIGPEGRVLFGDFGAATYIKQLPNTQRSLLEKIEVRALGNLLEDLLSTLGGEAAKNEQPRLVLLNELISKCQTINSSNRVSLEEFIQTIESV